MTVGGGYGYDDSTRVREQWEGLDASMGRAHDDLVGASAAGLPADIATAATAFLTTWRDLTTQSQHIARQFAASLVQIDRRYRHVDDEVHARFDALRGRLESSS